MKPATPLPWLIDSQQNVRSESEIQHAPISGAKVPALVAGVVGPDKDGLKQNAQYIAHACNAYPKLVAALRELHASPDSTVGEILRELGEGE